MWSNNKLVNVRNKSNGQTTRVRLPQAESMVRAGGYEFCSNWEGHKKKRLEERRKAEAAEKSKGRQLRREQ